MFAARAGDLETVQLLLEAGADLEARAIDGSTPLLVASRSTDALAGIDWRIIPYASGHEETALYLIERGADVTAADRLGRTALHAAVETNRPRLAGVLIEAGADVDARFAEPVAALRGDYISRRPYKGATPFWLAARAANLEMMQVLLDVGADPLLPNAFGTTPLMVAAGLGENDARRPADHRVVETVTLLIELGADVTATTPAGTTALHGAARDVGGRGHPAPRRPRRRRQRRGQPRPYTPLPGPVRQRQRTLREHRGAAARPRRPGAGSRAVATLSEAFKAADRSQHRKQTIDDFTFVGMGSDPPPEDLPVSVDHNKWLAEAIASRWEKPDDGPPSIEIEKEPS